MPTGLTTQPAANTTNSTYIADTIPQNMTPNKKYDVSITFRNTGNVQWSYASKIALVAVDDSTNDASLFNNTTTLTIKPQITVKKGNSYNWNFTMVAPRWSGNYTIAYRMEDGNGSYFGDTIVKHVIVGDSNTTTAFTAKSIKYYSPLSPKNPVTVKRGNWQNVSISVTNNGRYGWSENDHIRLAAVDYEPNDATVFYQGYLFYISPENVIQPGDTCSWKFKVLAPDDPGRYYVKYRMQKDGEWFGSTLNATIIVR